MVGPEGSCWTRLTASFRGLKYVSKERTERVAAIANALASADYDVITLQELWVFSDFELVRSAVSKKLPHSKFFYRCVRRPWVYPEGRESDALL